MKRIGSMQGQKVLVTGAGTGLGREMALEFARQGAKVALHYSHSIRGAEETAKQIVKVGGKAAIFQADFNDVAAVKALADSHRWRYHSLVLDR